MPAYLLQEADGTSPSGGTPHLTLITLSKEAAHKWKLGLSLGSWNYRSVHEIPLLEEKETK